MNAKNQRLMEYFLGAVMLLLLASSGASATTFFVDVEHGNDEADGLSWGTANRTIMSVYQKTPESGDKIHVAEGRYPEYIVMTQGVELLGGFSFGGTDPNPDIYISVIDGEHAHRCVFGAENAVLQGFTLENGWSTHGSGVLHEHISMKISRCIIKDCVAFGGNPMGGGGMYFFQSQSWIEDCVFDGNVVEQAPEYSATESLGGAVLGWAASPEFFRCTFKNNSVLETIPERLRLGGAIWFTASNPIIRDCLFENNSADTGGGVGWWNRSQPVLENSIFRNNSADAFGGGLCHIYNESSVLDRVLVVRNCIFENNHADEGGGMAVLRNNNVLIDNCLFVQNTAMTSGCALVVGGSSRCTIQQCTISDNQQSDPFSNNSGIDIDDTSVVSILSSIISSNESMYGIHLREGGNPLNQEIRNCDVHGHNQNYSSNLVDRTGWCSNISIHPLFTYFAEEPYCLSEPLTLDPMQIQLGRSPCIDSAGEDVSGQLFEYSSTRTDLVDDRSEADMGFHRYSKETRFIMDQPLPGEHSISQDTVIECRLIDYSDTITVEDIHMRLNASDVDPSIMPILGGYALTLVPPGGLQIMTDYWLDLTVDTIPEDLRFYVTFSTSPETAKEEPPEGSSLNVYFPMKNTFFSAEDDLVISLKIYNPWLNPVSADIHVAFVFAGDIFIYPVWDQDLHPTVIEGGPGITDTLDILAFEVPSGIGNLGPFDFYAIATGRDNFDLISPVATWSMYFVEP